MWPGGYLDSVGAIFAINEKSCLCLMVEFTPWSIVLMSFSLFKMHPNSFISEISQPFLHLCKVMSPWIRSESHTNIIHACHTGVISDFYTRLRISSQSSQI